ncbi:MAG: chalcone isomerase family protein [Bacteroidetes bacterium]|nr:chalcone isomerase family protein [Bacteroidota bacterium]
MKKILLILCIISSFSLTAQKKIGGIEIPVKVNFNETNLELNGAGVRTKYFMDMYVGGLYLSTKNDNGIIVMNDDKTMAIKLHIVSSLITTKKMVDAVDEGFKKSTKGKQAELKAEIDKFKAVFSPEIKENDVYDFVYIPEKGTVIYKNSKPTVTIKGLEFKKALFGIWLCSEPADTDLKAAMLGK